MLTKISLFKYLFLLFHSHSHHVMSMDEDMIRTVIMMDFRHSDLIIKIINMLNSFIKKVEIQDPTGLDKNSIIHQFLLVHNQQKYLNLNVYLEKIIIKIHNHLIKVAISNFLQQICYPFQNRSFLVHQLKFLIKSNLTLIFNLEIYMQRIKYFLIQPQVGILEYDLLLQNDINTKGNTQWFYFRIKNLPANKSIKINIVNFRKSDSLFNYGMLPCIHSS